MHDAFESLSDLSEFDFLEMRQFSGIDQSLPRMEDECHAWDDENPKREIPERYKAGLPGLSRESGQSVASLYLIARWWV